MGKFYPKQSGTTEQSFEIGAGHNKSGLTIDVTALAGDQTWKIPSTGGSFGDNLTTDGSGNLSWAPPGAASDSTVPTYISAAQTYRVNADRQALFIQDIVVDGDLVVDGALIDASDSIKGPVADSSILRKVNGIVTGNSDFTITDRWMNAFTPGEFSATFGAEFPTADENINRNALIIRNNDNLETSGISIKTPPADGSLTFNNLVFAAGDNTTNSFGGGGSLTFKSGTSTALPEAVNVSGGSLNLNAGSALSSQSSASASGGSFTGSAGTANTNNLNPATGGGFSFYSGNAASFGNESVFTFGANMGLTGGSINQENDQGGDVNFIAGDAGSRPLSQGGSINLTAGLGTTRGRIRVNGSNLYITEIGTGLAIAEGLDAKMGVATLAAGTVTVANASVTAQSRIFLTIQSANGGTVGQIYINGISPGVGFTIASTSILDTSIIAYQIIEAA